LYAEENSNGKYDHCFDLYRGNETSVNNYRAVAILNAYSKIFEFVVHEHGFTKTKLTIMNFVTFPDTATLTVCSRGQFDPIYFDFSSAFYLVFHSLILDTFRNSGVSTGCTRINWFCNY
jgi:hypothetical protein